MTEGAPHTFGEWSHSPVLSSRYLGPLGVANGVRPRAHSWPKSSKEMSTTRSSKLASSVTFRNRRVEFLVASPRHRDRGWNELHRSDTVPANSLMPNRHGSGRRKLRQRRLPCRCYAKGWDFRHNTKRRNLTADRSRYLHHIARRNQRLALLNQGLHSLGGISAKLRYDVSLEVGLSVE